MSMIALDLETTGLDPRRDAITEIAAVRFSGNQVEDQFQTLVNPNRSIPSNITQLTHISNEMVCHAPTIAEVVGAFSDFIGNDPIVGQNINFDLGFLRCVGISKKNQIIDTYDLAAALLPCSQRYSLSALAQQMGIVVTNAHRALADCMTTYQVYNKLIERANEIPLEVLNTLVSISASAQWNGTEVLREVLSKRVKAGEKRNPAASIPMPTLKAKWTDADDILKPVEHPTPLDEDALAAILEAGGEFSQHFEKFEPRDQQVQMLRTICDAFTNGHHMMIEAGTGTGKSFAYLIPSFKWAIQNGERVVISTNTINLQDQLISKDIPELSKALGMELRATVQKGRSNYLCPRRLTTMQMRGAQSPEEARVLCKLLVWLSEGGSGDRAEINLNGPQEREVWQRLSAENEGCRSNICQFRRKGQCPFYNTRDQAQRSQVIIVNHALLLADAAYAKGVLPEYKYLVIDEGHHLESAATGALSVRITPFDISRLLQELGSSKSGLLGRLLTALESQITQETMLGLQSRTEQISERAAELDPELVKLYKFIQEYLEFVRDGQPLTVYGQQLRITDASRTVSAWSEVENAWFNAESIFSDLLHQCADLHKDLAGLDDLDEETLEYIDLFGGNQDKLSDIRANLEALFLKPDSGYIYWIEITAVNNRLALCLAPLMVGPMIEEYLWHEKESIILTSATLTANQSFGYMKERLCADEADELRVGSPFDYEHSVMLYIPNDIPEPNMGSAQHMVEVTLENLCRAAGGRTLALFTSYAQLKRTSNAIAPMLSEAGFTVFEQGEGISSSALLETFRKTEKAILLGTRSFWEGVDIQGEALSVVVIVKLPFDVPSDPVIAARSESFENPFMQFSLPEAILKFRQGFGRLIRSKTDRGLVVILDNRLLTKRYGQEFLRSIPKCTQRVTSVRDLPREAKHWLDIGTHS